MTANLGNNPPTDDKPISLGEEKVDLSDKEKSSSFQSSNADKSNIHDLMGTMDNDDASDSDEKPINTNPMDPFASLN